MKSIRRIIEALTVIFVAAKLFGLIQWSWWFVLAPTYGQTLFVLFILLVKWVWWKFVLTEQERDAERIGDLLRKMADHHRPGKY